MKKLSLALLCTLRVLMPESNGNSKSTQDFLAQLQKVAAFSAWQTKPYRAYLPDHLLTSAIEDFKKFVEAITAEIPEIKDLLKPNASSPELGAQGEYNRTLCGIYFANFMFEHKFDVLQNWQPAPARLSTDSCKWLAGLVFTNTRCF